MFRVAGLFPVFNEENNMQKQTSNTFSKLFNQPSELLTRDQNLYPAPTSLRQTSRTCWNQAHGFCHAFAQDRYKELTGWECSKRGGPTIKELSEEQKQKDTAARLTISADLGHSRKAITYNYC